jgi:hypothetical protein
MKASVKRMISFELFGRRHQDSQFQQLFQAIQFTKMLLCCRKVIQGLHALQDWWGASGCFAEAIRVGGSIPSPCRLPGCTALAVLTEY